MEKPETRLLEEWKANHDLLKFHEDLKQKGRIRISVCEVG